MHGQPTWDWSNLLFRFDQSPYLHRKDHDRWMPIDQIRTTIVAEIAEIVGTGDATQCISAWRSAILAPISIKVRSSTKKVRRQIPTPII